MNYLTLTLTLVSICEAKKMLSEKEMFGSKSLKCLVCKALVEEMDLVIAKVDRHKRVEAGSYRLESDGSTGRKLVPYARSPAQLEEMIESVCDEFDNYAQAKEKISGEPTVVRIVDKSGGMSERFSQVDIVPDEDLNTRLKFYCETIVEEREDDILELLATDRSDTVKELCYTRSEICDKKKIEKEL